MPKGQTKRFFFVPLIALELFASPMRSDGAESIIAAVPGDVTAHPASSLSDQRAAPAVLSERLIPASSVSGRAINVEDYGAVGDGSTDNSAAIAKAVKACAAAGGCTLHFGSSTGNQFVMQGVQIAASDIRLVCGGGVTIINKSSNNYAIQFGDGIKQYHSDGINGCTFGQHGATRAVQGNVALKLNKLLQFTAENIAIKKYPSPPYSGLLAVDIGQSTIDKLQITDMLGTGLLITDSGMPVGGDVYLSNVQSNNNGVDGYDLSDNGGLYASNVTGYGNRRYGWYIHKIKYGNFNFFLSNCVGDSSGAHNWMISSLNNGQFSNVWGATQSSRKVNTSAVGFMLSGSEVENIVLNNVTAIYNNSHGIAIKNDGGMPSHISIVNGILGNTLHGNGQSGLGNGIWIDNYPTDVSIIGGMALNNSSGAIHAGQASTVQIVAVQGYSSAPMPCKGFSGRTSAIDKKEGARC